MQIQVCNLFKRGNCSEENAPHYFFVSNMTSFWNSNCANYSCGCFGEDTCNTDPDCIIFSNSTSPCGTFDYSVDSVFCVTEAEAGPLRETIRERLAELYPNGMPMCSRPPFENTVSFVCKCANGTCHKERLVRSVAEYNAMEKEDYNTYYVKGYASEVQDCYCPPEAECSICAPYLILTDYRVDFHGGLIFSIDGPFSEEDLLVLADSVYQMEEADFELDAQYILGVLPVRNNTAELRSYEKI